MTFTSTSNLELRDPDEPPRTTAGTTRWAMPCPRRATTLEVAPGVTLDPHGAAIRAGPHQPVAAARRDRRPRRLDGGGLLHRAGRVQGAVGADVRHAAGRPADPAGDRDPHAPGPHRAGHWLCERWNAPLWISATDYNAARWLAAAPPASAANTRRTSSLRTGWSTRTPWRRSAAAPTTTRAWCPTCRARFRRMQDGDTVRIGGRDWRCISGFGHAPEHIALYCEELRVLIRGDMMLPRISTNVSVYDVEPESNPLKRLPRLDRQVRRAAGGHAGAAVARQAVPRPARAHPPAARPPPRPAGRSDGGVRDSAPVGGRRAAGHVQAQARPAPDHVCHGRSSGAPACAVVCRQAAPAARRRLASAASRRLTAPASPGVTRAAAPRP